MATSCLPFLYPARIVQRPLRTPTVRTRLRQLHDGTSPSTRLPLSSPFSRTGRPSKTSAYLQRDPIPFELPPDLADELASEVAGDANKPRGTITPSERRAFDRIFKGMARRRRDSAAQARFGKQQLGSLPADDTADVHRRVSDIVTRASDELAARQKETSKSSKTLRAKAGNDNPDDDPDATDTSLFRIEQPLSTEEQRRRILTMFPQSLRHAASGALGIPTQRQETAQALRAHDKDHFLPPVDAKAVAAAAAAQRACQERQTAMEHAMLAQPSDFALWDYMEDCVFPLVVEFGLATSEVLHGPPVRVLESPSAAETEAKASTAATNAATSHGPFDAPPPPPFKRGRGRPKKDASTSRRARPSAAATAAASARLAQFGPLYPALLLHAVRLLDTRFYNDSASGAHHIPTSKAAPLTRLAPLSLPASSPLALAVLPRVRALGVGSHVLGASTPLYNELLRIHWTRYGDTAAVLRLLAEMQRAGLAFDGATLDVVRSLEWHLLPLTRRGGSSNDSRPVRPGVLFGGGLVSRDRSAQAGSISHQDATLAQTAMVHLPDLAALPEQLRYWRAQVERGIYTAQ